MKKIVIVILTVALSTLLLFGEESKGNDKQYKKKVLENQKEILANQKKIMKEVVYGRGFKDRKILNVLGSPTAHTLKKGEFIVGLGPINYGLTNNLQVGSNILLFLFQYKNLNFKYRIFHSEKIAISSALYYGNFSLSIFDSDENFSKITPSLMFSLMKREKVSWHLSGQYIVIMSDYDILDGGIEIFSKGSNTTLGYEYSLSNRTKFVSEFAYDFTYEGIRLGGAFLWGWKSFRLKVGLMDYDYKNFNSAYFPYVNLWWRFNG